jgi:hypothetical protein
MDVDQWIRQMSDAYALVGASFSSDKKAVLLANLSEENSQEKKEIVAEAVDAMTRLFFKKVSNGETFGSLSRIKKQFGRSLEENYGMSSGPFINMAKTYWTYKLEVGDLIPENNDLILSQILLKIEIDIAGVFFPTRGPIEVPMNERRKTQRQILQEYATGINVDAFLANNPILGTTTQTGSSFERAYRNRIVLMNVVFIFWLSVVINAIRAVYSLTVGNFGSAGASFLWATGSFVAWYCVHIWALRHPKD